MLSGKTEIGDVVRDIAANEARNGDIDDLIYTKSSIQRCSTSTPSVELLTGNESILAEKARVEEHSGNAPPNTERKDLHSTPAANRASRPTDADRLHRNGDSATDVGDGAKQDI